MKFWKKRYTADKTISFKIFIFASTLLLKLTDNLFFLAMLLLFKSDKREVLCKMMVGLTMTLSYWWTSKDLKRKSNLNLTWCWNVCVKLLRALSLTLPYNTLLSQISFQDQQRSLRFSSILLEEIERRCTSRCFSLPLLLFKTFRRRMSLRCIWSNLRIQTNFHFSSHSIKRWELQRSNLQKFLWFWNQFSCQLKARFLTYSQCN